jgi:hypothetical protein
MRGPAAAVAAVILALGLTAHAVSAPPAIIIAAAVGHGGRVRMGTWTPVWIDLVAPAEGLDGAAVVAATAPAGAPGRAVRYATAVRAAAGARVRVFVPAVFYDARAPGSVGIETPRGLIASQPLPRLRPAEEMVVALSAEPLGAEDVTARTRRADVVYVRPQDLPPVWQAYEGVSLLVVRDLDERRLDDAQRQAIRRWVWTGGRLLAMPSGDDVRHLRGPTLEPVLPGLVTGRTEPAGTGRTVLALRARPGGEPFGHGAVRGLRWRYGRGQVVMWDRDAADPRARGRPEMLEAWGAVLALDPAAPLGDLEPTLAPLRPVPVRTQLMVAALVLAYVLAVRHLSRLAASVRAVAVAVVAASVVTATFVAVRVAAAARRDASGVVASIVVVGLPGADDGLVHFLARTVTAQTGIFALQAPGELLLRPAPAAGVTIEHGLQTTVRGSAGGVRLAGTGVVPVAMTGSLDRLPAGDVVAVANRTGVRLERPWIALGGRVQSVPEIGASARITLDAQRWQTRDRLQRTEPNHQLLLWAFSLLESDAILKMTPTWLVGWLRDPALGLRWGNRFESTHALILVPLTPR